MVLGLLSYSYMGLRIKKLRLQVHRVLLLIMTAVIGLQAAFLTPVSASISLAQQGPINSASGANYSNQQCAQIYNIPRRMGLVKWSADLKENSSAKKYHDEIISTAAEWIENPNYMHTDKLIHYTQNGGRSRPGLLPIWSNRYVLESVLNVKNGVTSWQGALGRDMGPIGNNRWQSYYWRNVFKIWCQAVAKYVPKVLSAQGPLGPLSEWGANARTWGEGVYDFLGTAGLLGPLSVLGWLGPMGAILAEKKLTLNTNGEYLNMQGKIVRQISVPFGETSRRYNVFNYYKEDYVQKLSDKRDLDSSFMFDGILKRHEDSRKMRVRIAQRELTTIMIIPDYNYTKHEDGIYHSMNFMIRVRNDRGQIIAESNVVDYTNFVQVINPENSQVTVEIIRQGTRDENKKEDQKFRFLVVGDPFSPDQTF